MRLIREFLSGPVILMRKGVQESKKEDDGDSVALMRYMSDNFEDIFMNVSALTGRFQVVHVGLIFLI